MDQISVVIPLSAIAGAANFSPSELAATLANSSTIKQQLEQTQNRCNTLTQTLSAAGRNLQLILDEVPDPFDKAKALRQLAKEIIEAAKAENK